MRFLTCVRTVAAAGALSAVGLVPLSAPAWAGTTSTSTVTTYTWTGTDAASSTNPNPTWSDGGNWSGSVAPPAGTPVNLDFPASACTVSGACNGADNITGLIVDTLTIGTPSATSGNPPPGYTMGAGPGVSITLDGGLTLTGASSATATFSTDFFSIPITLGANNTWNLAGPSYLTLESDVSGTAYSVDMNVGGGGILALGGTANEVGAVTVTGASSSATGQGSESNGQVQIESDLNGTDGNPVTASNVALMTPGATVGPVGLTGDWLSVVSQGSSVGTGVMAGNGAVTFDSSTLVDYNSLSAPTGTPTAGTDYPEITSTATATLGDAQLLIEADCGMANNTTFTLLSASSVSGVFDHYVPNVPGPNGPAPTSPITNGEVIQAAPAPNGSCGTSPGPYLRINYTSTAVTATVVPQPTSTTTVSVNPTSPQVNEPYYLVATVAPNPSGSAVPSGYVSFSVGGTPVSSCASVPVQPVTSGGTTTYQATCSMPAPAAPASESVSAAYDGDPILASSNGSATVTIAKGTTSTSLGASTTNPYEGQPVTYTATVAPAPPSGSTPATPGGKVEFFDGTNPVTGCTAQTLSATAAGEQATCQQTYAATGSHSISAEYLGDGDFATSTSNTVAVSVQAPATSTTSVAFSPAPTSTSPVAGQPVTVIATVASSATPSGQVSFYADGAANPISASCTGVALSASSPYTASCTASFAAAGSHSVTAVFTSSTPAVSGSNGSANLTVQKAGSSTTVAVSPASPAVGGNVTYTATVSAAAPGSGTPGGTVSFSDGGSPISGCSSVALDGASPDTATCTVTYDSTGSHSVTATYAGGSDFTGSTSAPVSVTIGLPPGTTSAQAGTSTTTGGSATVTNDQVTADATGGEGTVTVAQYTSDPAGAPGFQASGNYFDVSVSSGSTFGSVTVSDCNLSGGTNLYWWNPTAGTGGAWEPVTGSPGPTYSAGPPACITVTLTSSTSPTLAQLGGTVFASGKPASGYWMAAGDGAVFSFDATFQGSVGGSRLSAPVVGIAADPCTGGYWEAAADGGVFAFHAPFYGSMGGEKLAQPIVGISSYVTYGTGGQPVRCGYRLVASDGGVFGFNAPFDGSMGGHVLDKPIVGMASDPTTGGYWLVASDGGVFAFDAPFDGSMGGHVLDKPIVGMAFDPMTGGYWLVASDGGIFAFDAPFHGSLGGISLTKPIVAMTADPETGGYWLVGSDGGVFSFDAPFHGSMGGTPLDTSVVGIAAAGA